MEKTDYRLLSEQITGLSETSCDQVPVFANASALLYEAMPDVNWAGFYLVKNGRLLVGPFQGKPACVLIEKGRGVCGTAYAEDKVQLVPDVHRFPGHIACDSASNSEIVLPVHNNGEIIAVLDIDSPLYDRFSTDDLYGLVLFVSTLEQIFSNSPD